jgi:hypothetical protein
MVRSRSESIVFDSNKRFSLHSATEEAMKSRDAADALGMSISHVRRLVATGGLAGEQRGPGGHWDILDLNFERKRRVALSPAQERVIEALGEGRFRAIGVQGRRPLHVLESSHGQKRRVDFMVSIPKLRASLEEGLTVTLTLVRVHGRLACKIVCHGKTKGWLFAAHPSIEWAETVPLARVFVVPKLNSRADLCMRWLVSFTGPGVKAPSSTERTRYSYAKAGEDAKVSSTTMNVLQRRRLVRFTQGQGAEGWSLTEAGARLSRVLRQATLTTARAAVHSDMPP